MNRSDFNFDLPQSLIAHYPLTERTSSRLLCLDGASGKLEHSHFYNLFERLKPGDLLLLNNTKVLPARMFGQKMSGGKIEILVERIVDDHSAWVHCKASKRPQVNSQLLLENQIRATVLEDKNSLLLLSFLDDKNVITLLEAYGRIPLPTYIRRVSEISDKERYQTVYAKEQGSVAAPTAGLHFDQVLLQQLKEKGINIEYLTLHVGAGTFQPVRVEDLSQHVMHYEYAYLSKEVSEKIKQTKQNNKRVIAVGTTSVRTIETASRSGETKPYSGETNLFITPGFQFNCVDAMITNFHLPESTLMMLVCAFGGYEFVMKAYQEAIQNHYRFYSYGDAMFITRKK